jgi:hypothetical protein
MTTFNFEGQRIKTYGAFSHMTKTQFIGAAQERANAIRKYKNPGGIPTFPATLTEEDANNLANAIEKKKPFEFASYAGIRIINRIIR